MGARRDERRKGNGMRLVVIGDVGVVDDMMHIGDEAMTEALLDETRARGIRSFTVVSNAPAETARRYGVDAVGRIGFAGDRRAVRGRLAAVRESLAGRRVLGDDDPLWRVVDAVAGADGVVIAGGGNLASTWPAHIAERLALALVADRVGRPLVITGQTLGPRLDDGDDALLAELLAHARLVGVRERASAALAGRLGASGVRAGCDDASFLAEDPGQTPAPGILVSLSTHVGGVPRADVVSVLARCLDHLAARTGLPVTFHPHFGSLRPDRIAGDAALHDGVRTAMTSASTALGPGTSRAAAALARRAAVLVSSRYHPVVFAAPVGVPVVALAADDYTALKLGGATGWWGQRPVALAAAGVDVFEAAWLSRQSVRATADDLRPRARADAAAWWDRVVDVIDAG